MSTDDPQPVSDEQVGTPLASSQSELQPTSTSAVCVAEPQIPQVDTFESDGDDTSYLTEGCDFHLLLRHPITPLVIQEIPAGVVGNVKESTSTRHDRFERNAIQNAIRHGCRC